jgi:hypothetical protein
MTSIATTQINPQLVQRHPKMDEAFEITWQIRLVLENLKLQPDLVTHAMIVEHRNITILFVPLDVHRMQGQMGPYENATHRIQAVLNGRPVATSNSDGFRYAILLSRPKRLPKLIELPELESGCLQIGVQPGDTPLSAAWDDLGHMLVAGMTGSGKSTFLRSIAYQAIADDLKLLIGDRPRTTFPMLSGHPALIDGMANTPGEYERLVYRALQICAEREEIFSRNTEFPEKLSEYNQMAIRDGDDPLPRVLIMLDEFNATQNDLGGPKGSFGRAISNLIYEGRKFGVDVILATQNMKMNTLGDLRDQVATIVAFKVNNVATARNVGVKAAVRIPIKKKGLAITNRWGLVQTYFLPKIKLIHAQHRPPVAILEEERKIAVRALRETDGKMSIPVLKEWGLSERRARTMVEDWERKGWLKKDPSRSNARCVTDTLAAKLSNCQTGQTVSNASNERQAVSRA